MQLYNNFESLDKIHEFLTEHKLSILTKEEIEQTITILQLEW